MHYIIQLAVVVVLGSMPKAFRRNERFSNLFEPMLWADAGKVHPSRHFPCFQAYPSGMLPSGCYCRQGAADAVLVGHESRLSFR